MGLNTNSAQRTYLKVKDGKFYKSDDKELAQPFASLTGKITGMFFKEDTYEGKKIKKLAVVVQDGDQNYQFDVSFNSSYASTLISFLKNPTLDLTQDIILAPKENTKPDGNKAYSIMAGTDKNFKPFYTKTTPNGLPQMKKIRVNGQDMWDREDMINFLEEVVITDLIPKFRGDGQATAPVTPKPAGPVQAQKPDAGTKPKNTPPPPVEDDDDSLPF